MIFFWKFLRFFVVENVWVFFFWFFSCWKCLIFFLKILRLKKKHFDIFFLLKMFEIFFLKLLIFFLKLLSFFFVLKCFWFFRFWNFLSFFSLISIRKIFLDETSRNFYFEQSFTSKTYFYDFCTWFALVLLRNYYPISFYTCFTKELLSKPLFSWFSWRIFVTDERTKSHPTFSIYKRKISYNKVSSKIHN